MFVPFQIDGKMEMTATGEVDTSKAYTKEAGYSEDYSQPKEPPPPYDESQFTNGSSATPAAAAAPAGPANPFTQQQYNQSSSNPFRR